MNMKVDRDSGKSVEMLNGQARKIWRFSSNEFWNNIGCLVLDTFFVLGG